MNTETNTQVNVTDHLDHTGGRAQRKKNHEYKEMDQTTAEGCQVI